MASPPPVKPAASIIVCAPVIGNPNEYKVLFLQRNNRGPFGGLMVFPGGGLDKADQDPIWGKILGKPATRELAFQVAAIREAFEECGLHVFKPDLKVSPEEIAKWRDQVHDDGKKFIEMAQKTGSIPDLSRLALFSNWITPTMETKRFDTFFFITVLPKPVAPQSKRMSADGGETLSLTWYTPSECIAAFRKGEIKLFPPQFITMAEMAKLSLDDLKKILSGATKRVVTPWQPELGPGGLVLPGDEFHSTTKNTVKAGSKNRVLLTRSPNGAGIADIEWIRETKL
ncbi:hypothetical protein SmJEL517_g03798 [Synchytrium microbalum]|uniref:Nudix hydrolase domain-containing protein n=1 Tax=Synchytrium microbalum TaxID=1806994 RepID=A0A507C6S9_9FUNG|nr:uncharacterized protein SmJEL517_g03798 [Synchytrium microbalum]TPX33185.1 hypothetical protein SmJEL517_g03798 [Synchytrium microbalum]